MNDNSLRLLIMCSATNLAVLGSWFQRKDIHRHSWLSNDGRTCKELDHILVKDRSLFTSCRVYRGVEAQANTDHRLVIAEMRHLRPAHAPNVRTQRKLDVEALTQDKELAKRYSIAVSNSFAALADLPDNVEASWSVVRTTILTAAQGTIPVTCVKNRPWLTPAVCPRQEARSSTQRIRRRVAQVQGHIQGTIKSRSGGILHESRRGSGGRY